ncbi:Gfo/Idh/MocA family oxidoreductase [Aeromonas lusitana]|uniref:Oxidoreductase n=1 Tax=Aeromonas lusitana TaxID=931529 RepID=A0A2M8HDE0_9GAMM|nr:Gfo/Idh/MocA family oxidoreductase [Aeromonas lusitana]PJC94565.1 oxidoreductase [Aeromonas lusitana]
MKIGFVGLGAVVQTAYLPALAALAEDAEIWGFDPVQTLPGVIQAQSLEALLALPLDRLVIATPSLLHLPVLEQALASSIPLILVEKPVVASLAQHDRLRALLADPAVAGRVLALDHWMARSAVQQLLCGELDAGWQPLTDGARVRPATILDVAEVEGFLLEPCGIDAQGHPFALNFATGEPDKRIFHHPDGVILDIGTHVLAMIRELLVALGGDDSLHLAAEGVSDRLGNPIERGDLSTAEGRACLRGEAAGVPLTLWLDKYAGPGVEKKGLSLLLKDGRRLELLRSGNQAWLHHHENGLVQSWQLEGPLYRHCIAQTLLAPVPVAGWGGATARRLREVGLLLGLQQDLRGPH